jgi:hypothetical protein
VIASASIRSWSASRRRIGSRSAVIRFPDKAIGGVVDLTSPFGIYAHFFTSVAYTERTGAGML